MSIQVIGGKRLDTSKARKWSLDYHDGRNMHYGDLYLSSGGTWYVYTPAEWSKGHRWELIDPADAIEQYGEGLTDANKVEILDAAGLNTE